MEDIDTNGRRRPDGYAELLAQAAQAVREKPFAKWQALRAVHLCPTLDDAQVRLLGILIELAGAETWSNGQPAAGAGTELLCELSGWSRSKVIRVARSLEAQGMLFRHFTDDGHRSPGDGWDLSPLWLHLDVMVATVDGIFEQRRAARRCGTIVRVEANKTRGGITDDTPINTDFHQTLKKVEPCSPAVEAALAEDHRPKSARPRFQPQTIRETPTHSRAIEQLRAVSWAFDRALLQHAYDPDDPSMSEVSKAVVDMARQMGVPLADVGAAQDRHPILSIAAIICLAANRSHPGYPGKWKVANGPGWARTMLGSPPSAIDVWTSVAQDVRLRQLN